MNIINSSYHKRQKGERQKMVNKISLFIVTHTMSCGEISERKVKQ